MFRCVLSKLVKENDTPPNFVYNNYYINRNFYFEMNSIIPHMEKESKL